MAKNKGKGITITSSKSLFDIRRTGGKDPYEASTDMEAVKRRRAIEAHQEKIRNRDIFL